jgi:hypothetical protein
MQAHPKPICSSTHQHSIFVAHTHTDVLHPQWGMSGRQDAAVAQVRSWHRADLLGRQLYDRFRAQSGSSQRSPTSGKRRLTSRARLTERPATFARRRIALSASRMRDRARLRPVPRKDYLQLRRSNFCSKELFSPTTVHALCSGQQPSFCLFCHWAPTWPTNIGPRTPTSSQVREPCAALGGLLAARAFHMKPHTFNGPTDA